MTVVYFGGMFMKPSAMAWLMVCVLAAPALADRVTLKDGRTFEGAVKEAEGRIVIEMAHGSVSFPLTEVSGVEHMPTPAETLEASLTRIDRTDADAVYQLAVWARDNDLARRGDELLRECIALNADHPAARRLLGQVKVDGKWQDTPAALQLAQGKLDAGRNDELLNDLLPALELVVANAQQKTAIRELEALARVRQGQFEQAAKCLENIAAKCATADAGRYAAMAEILKAHPDGMYLVQEAYPPEAALLATTEPSVDAGPASLTRPAVLMAALRDLAKNHVKNGRSFMDEGKKLEMTEPEAAKAKYNLAQKSFESADAVSPNISRSYRVEIARRQIAMITRDMNTEAGKFDALRAELGKRDLTPAQYKDLIGRMNRSLANVRSDLDAILQLASPFDRELVLEITDSSQRLQKVTALKDTLTQFSGPK